MIVKDLTDKILSTFDLSTGRLEDTGVRVESSTPFVPGSPAVYQTKCVGRTKSGDKLFADVIVKPAVPDTMPTHTCERVMRYIPFTAEELADMASKVVPTVEELAERIKTNARAIIELADPNHEASESSSVSQLISDAVESGEKKIEEVGSKWKSAVSSLLGR